MPETVPPSKVTVLDLPLKVPLFVKPSAVIPKLLPDTSNIVPLAIVTLPVM